MIFDPDQRPDLTNWCEISGTILAMHLAAVLSATVFDVHKETILLRSAF